MGITKIYRSLNSEQKEIVDTKSYPLGVKDLSPVLKGFKAAGADVFLGLTYPPDNILAASQAKEVDFNPPVYLAAVGTAFPFYRDRFKGAAMPELLAELITGSVYGTQRRRWEAAER